MKYAIVTSKSFMQEFKNLFKKYRSLDSDIENLKQKLLKNPKLGSDLGDNMRKVRMAIASKNKGKRGGARVITYLLYIDVEQSKIYLLTIYDKGEKDSISRKEILQLKIENNLL